MVCWSDSTEAGSATREAMLGTKGARADTVVFIFSVRVLRSSIDCWRASMVIKRPEQSDTRLLCSLMDGGVLVEGMRRRL